MHTFEVYPLFDIHPVRGLGAWLWDEAGKKYLDFYGGHAVVSIGHNHPHYIDRIKTQLRSLGFYSNSVHLPLQGELALKLGEVSGYGDYALFLVNSGAEANENALKLASFHTGRRKVICFDKAFHGRTSLSVAVTDNPKVVAPINEHDGVIRLPLNDRQALEEHLDESVAAVIVEGIQGVGGIRLPDDDFLQLLRERCNQTGTVLILDEVQSGFGRPGRFFAHQHAGIRPDLITMAKGMGNGFPVGGLLISPEFEAVKGRLGTTFGGNPLACAASLAVLEVIEEEGLQDHSQALGEHMLDELRQLEHPAIRAVRGRGLMLALELEGPIKPLRERLLLQERIFTGSSSNPNVLRLLPPLNITQEEVEYFLRGLQKALSSPEA